MTGEEKKKNPGAFSPGHAKVGGRKPGGKNKLPTMIRTRNMEVRSKALKGLTPLEVMLDNMRFSHAEAEKIFKHLAREKALSPARTMTATQIKQLGELLSYRKTAQDAARDAAPYLHNKLTAVTHSGPGGGPLEVADETPPERRKAALAFLLAKMEPGEKIDITVSKTLEKEPVVIDHEPAD
jgi:hypothetical protein